MISFSFLLSFLFIDIMGKSNSNWILMSLC
uniref:Uncharacterized protein n=1 Tax=Rhizophora mucronata TaxID=61149 RepID=A0A2P2PHN6_RHIMU